MKIRMKQTVEDSHKHWVFGDDGMPVDDRPQFDVRIFTEGVEYDEANGGPDWERRATGFVEMGIAEIV